MDFKQGLSKRIVVVFALMSALAAGVFAVGIIATVHVVERNLTTTSLGGGLNRLLRMNSTREWNHQPEKDELFFYQGGQGGHGDGPGAGCAGPGFPGDSVSG